MSERASTNAVANGSRLDVPTAAATATTSTDADDQASKYKRRRRRRQSVWASLCDNPYMIVAATVVFVYYKWSQPPAVVTVSPTATATFSAATVPAMTAATAGQSVPTLAQDDFHTEDGGVVISETLRRSEVLAHQFAAERRRRSGQQQPSSKIQSLLQEWKEQVDLDIRNNIKAGAPRWVQPFLLPPLVSGRESHQHTSQLEQDIPLFNSKRMDAPPMAWQVEWKTLQLEGKSAGPRIDYTDKTKYKYPDVLMEPPVQGGYPALKTMQELMEIWPQDDDLEGTFTEGLMHFDFQNATQRQAAIRFREKELPFKMINVDEVQAATLRWTDEYLGREFYDKYAVKQAAKSGHPPPHYDTMPASALAQESTSNFFAFFVENRWDVKVHGLPPDLFNDWNFKTWAAHANYADAVSLTADQPHMYLQTGIKPDDRYKDPSTFTFIARDLPSWSSTTANFFNFEPEEQKGIQCRFGERGVVAATHFDTGRNMIAMITGAKRYVLSPPNQCSKQGLFTAPESPVYRHSVLNFGHISEMDDPTNGMSAKERAWMSKAATMQAIDTVLKQGEVLYIPSHWFHYIVSLQKSAQCNARSGIDKYGSREFGGSRDVAECRDREEESVKAANL